ncbi:MAG TPA: protease inhibitor I42 family protein [Candidatus Limnocylindrales bacterium]|nr:protease inhibitor I42 family protein [Candidatus Limnocylindrales bacterium]
MPRWLIWSLVAVVLAVAGVWGGIALYRQATYGSRYAEQQRDVKASVGDVFTLVVPDRGPSVGDDWTAAVADAAIVTEEKSELIPDSLSDRWFGAAPGGGGGDRLITFRAKAPGTTKITLTNCYRGCQTAQDQAESRSVSWNVTVER